MRIKVKIVIMAFLLLHNGWAFAQTLSNKGREFWVGYSHHQFMEPGKDNSQEMILYFSAEQTAVVTVSINGTGYAKTYTVPANSVVASELIPKGAFSTPSSPFDARLYTAPPPFGGTGSEGLFTKGIHIQSTAPIVAYAHIYSKNNSGAAMLIPVEAWGNSYMSLNTQQFLSTAYGANRDCFSWMYVVASENNTRVRIVPSVLTRNGHPANVPFVVDLQKGQIYQILGAAKDNEASLDLTGTTVTSINNGAEPCHAIGVFSGSSETQIACTGFNGTGDNLMQQLFPYSAWGRQYLTAPSCVDNSPTQHNINVYRIAVKDPATVVKKNGQQLYGINGNYYEYQSNTADYIEADQPIMLAQYLPSKNACGYVGDGDPEMIYVSPLEQSINHVSFYRNDRQNIKVNYLSIIIPKAGVSSLKIDGVAGGYDDVYDHLNFPGYAVVTKRWAAAQAQCIVESDSAFTGITYGLGGNESYGYNAGTMLGNLSGLSSFKNKYSPTNEPSAYTCVKTPVELSVLMRYKPDQLDWRLSQLAGIISPANDVVINAPVPVGMVTVNGVEFFKYTLPGYYAFTKAGTFSVPLYSAGVNVPTCDQTELVAYKVLVKPAYSTNFNVVYNNCTTSENIHFSGEDVFSTKENIKRWEWIFSDNTTASGKTVDHVFKTGNHSAELFAIDSVGCAADTVKTFSLSDKPTTPAFDIVTADTCEGSTIKFVDRNNQAGVKQSFWDFGNKDTVTIIAGTNTTKKFATYGVQTIKHVVKFSDACISDTAMQNISIYASPVLKISYPTSCLENGAVQFTSASTVPDGQQIATYAWDFGDVNATPQNPNTSNIADPAHNFSQGTAYNIVYAATSEKGCRKDSTYKISFSIKPQLAFGLLGDVCENSKILSIAKASVINGVQGTGSYRGPGVDAAGNFSPSAAGAGTHDIWFTFRSKNDCQDSIRQTIKVHPKPAANFDATKEICTDGATVITDHSTIANGYTITNWNWNFGDGNTAANNNNNAFSKSYASYGKYTVQLVAVSDKGCTSDTVKNDVAVHPYPTADFSLPASVCMPGGEALFTNLSNSLDGAPLTFTWSFGDGSTSTDKDAKHVYVSIGNYNIQLKASAGNCSSISAVKPFGNFINKPTAAFTVDPEIVCQGTDNVFTDKSVANNSTIKSRNWDFADGTVSTDRNPVKRYAAPGVYNVILTITDAAGCISDPAKKNITVNIQPVIEAGPSVAVLPGEKVTFKATANNVTDINFHWTPSSLLDNASILAPTYIAIHDQTFVLTATAGESSCTATDELTVKILKPVKVPNAFSPNGDGINDNWQITNLADYEKATVQVYNRYGQIVYRSEGYGTPWDGRTNGSSLPVGTYYYVIELNKGFAPLTGSVTILR